MPYISIELECPLTTYAMGLPYLSAWFTDITIFIMTGYCELQHKKKRNQRNECYSSTFIPPDVDCPIAFGGLLWEWVNWVNSKAWSTLNWGIGKIQSWKEVGTSSPALKRPTTPSQNGLVTAPKKKGDVNCFLSVMQSIKINSIPQIGVYGRWVWYCCVCLVNSGSNCSGRFTDSRKKTTYHTPQDSLTYVFPI